VPAVSYRWDFGDGTSTEGAHVSHCYTRAAHLTVRVTVDGVDGVPAEQSFQVKVTGNLSVMPKLTENRRFVEPTDRGR
jgi:alpha-galactosidase